MEVGVRWWWVGGPPAPLRVRRSKVAIISGAWRDESGRLSSPRAGRELALSVTYGACLQGSSDPLRLFQNRVNAPRRGTSESESLDKSWLSQYDLMSFGGPPVTVQSLEEEAELVRLQQQQSEMEAQVLAAPPKLVYSNLILRFSRKLVVAVTQRWDTSVGDIQKVAPPRWKDEESGGRILELCILHLAMSEMAVLRTRHQIVINEAVDLSKRFCDGAAPRIINGCLRTFVNHYHLELDTYKYNS